MRAEPANGLSQNLSIAVRRRTLAGFGTAWSALAADRLIRSEQRITHFSPIEHGVGRILQGSHAGTKIIDIVEVILNGLADHISSATVERLVLSESAAYRSAMPGTTDAVWVNLDEPPSITAMIDQISG